MFRTAVLAYLLSFASTAARAAPLDALLAASGACDAPAAAAAIGAGAPVDGLDDTGNPAIGRAFLCPARR